MRAEEGVQGTVVDRAEERTSRGVVGETVGLVGVEEGRAAGDEGGERERGRSAHNVGSAQLGCGGVSLLEQRLEGLRGVRAMKKTKENKESTLVP